MEPAPRSDPREGRETGRAFAEFCSSQHDLSFEAMDFIIDHVGTPAEALEEAICLHIALSMRSGTFAEVKEANRGILSAIEEFVKAVPSASEKLRKFQEFSERYKAACDKAERDYIEVQRSLADQRDDLSF